MSLAALCKPRPSVFERDRRATVLNLDNFLGGRIPGEEFFRENYFTVGMTTLVDRCLRHLAGGNAGSSVFLLSQAMGGGKTHSMMALGFLARDPALRAKVLGAKDPAPKLGKSRVIGFNGRNVEPAFGIWGALAEQLGRKDHFRDYYQPLSAPGPQAWKELLAGQPTIVLLDELPPYMEHARSKQIGNSDLSVVTATALANLLVAVSEMDSVCVVLSDLADANWQAGGQMIQQALANLRNEAKRVAVPLTPVNPQGDELYHILRTRLFEQLPGAAEIDQVAGAYRTAHVEAVRMGLTTTPSEGLFQQVRDAYPFHPAWRDLIGRFKENEGFQQTRGVIRLMQMIVSNTWKEGKADRLDLLHPYDFDLSDTEIASEVRTISPHLSEAMAHDISHGGQAEAESIDQKNGNGDATDAARLILLASLSTIPGAVHGLREFELYDTLQRPGRDLSAFKATVLDILDTRAWYLHRSPDGRLFFKNQQNLAAKLRATAHGLNKESVLKQLRSFLETRFAPDLKDVYQELKVLPGLDEVTLEQDKVLLILAEPNGGHQGLALSEQWQGWWKQQAFKNRVLFLSGSRLVMQNVQDGARQLRALQSIEEDLKNEGTASNDPQWRALDGLRDRLLTQLSSALTQAFDTIIYPSINDALRSQSVTLEFRGNDFRGESVLRKTLDDAQKFTKETLSDSFRTKAESRLFTSKQTLWNEVRRRAATTTTWQFHPARALDELKADCLRKGLWQEQGQYIEKGPFPKPATSVAIRELSRDDDGNAWLRIEPLNGDTVHYETGANVPTTASPRVADFQRFEVKHLRYQFLCVDGQGGHPTGAPKEWVNKIELRHKVIEGQPTQIELRATPTGTIRYSTNGSSPDNGAIYDGKFAVPSGCRYVLAIAEADGIRSDLLRVNVNTNGPKFTLELNKPCRWKKRHRLDDTGAVWAWLERLKESGGVARTITVSAESESGEQTVEFVGSASQGYASHALRELCEKLQPLVGDPNKLLLRVNQVDFEKGQQLADWVRAAAEPLNSSEVEQDGACG